MTVRFESINLPNHFIRHRNYECWLDPFGEYGGEDLFNADSAFHVVDGLSGVDKVRHTSISSEVSLSMLKLGLLVIESMEFEKKLVSDIKCYEKFFNRGI